MSISQHLNKPARILIVEDEQLVAMDMEMQLLAFGFEVVGMADTGNEALHLAATVQSDLVLMDVKLRGPMDGVAAAEELQRRAAIPVIFVTAFGSQEALRRVQEVGTMATLQSRTGQRTYEKPSTLRLSDTERSHEEFSSNRRRQLPDP